MAVVMSGRSRARKEWTLAYWSIPVKSHACVERLVPLLPHRPRLNRPLRTGERGAGSENCVSHRAQCMAGVSMQTTRSFLRSRSQLRRLCGADCFGVMPLAASDRCLTLANWAVHPHH